MTADSWLLPGFCCQLTCTLCCIIRSCRSPWGLAPVPMPADDASDGARMAFARQQRHRRDARRRANSGDGSDLFGGSDDDGSGTEDEGSVVSGSEGTRSVGSDDSAASGLLGGLFSEDYGDQHTVRTAAVVVSPPTKVRPSILQLR